MKNRVHLIAYPDSFGPGLAELYTALNEKFSGAVTGVHILPLYPSNADSGFSPLTHKEVDPRYGTWEDVQRISADYDLCLDLTINHISDASEEFKDFISKGMKSDYADLFVHVDQLGEISADDLAKIHIRKEKEPFREVTLADGTKTRVWCTFTEHQIDLNYDNQRTYQLMEDNIRFLTQQGVKLFRLDAFGYTTKRIGTSCFLVEPDVWEILEWIDHAAKDNGAEVLPEVHDHPSFQVAIGKRGMRPYAFSLPILVLYSLLDANSVYLKRWLRSCHDNQVTVLDTHDGICIPDAEDYLPRSKVQAVIDNVSQRSADPIMRRSAANVSSVGAIYQLTCTYYDALKQNDDAYIAARAIQLFSPGLPQVYYVGLLAGMNDVERMEESGELRDINRHRYTLDEVDAELERSVVRRFMQLMRFRNTHPAFDGRFDLKYSNDSSIDMLWRNGESWCELFVDLNFKTSEIRYLDPHTRRALKLKC